MVISGSFGSEVFVSNNSHATLGGSSIAITGSGHGGVVAVNESTINVAKGSQISGNVMDVFCDPRSLSTGTNNILGEGNINCANLQPFDFDVLP